jgi:hypothetical protein
MWHKTNDLFLSCPPTTTKKNQFLPFLAFISTLLPYLTFHPIFHPSTVKVHMNRPFYPCVGPTTTLLLPPSPNSWPGAPSAMDGDFSCLVLHQANRDRELPATAGEGEWCQVSMPMLDGSSAGFRGARSLDPPA